MAEKIKVGIMILGNVDECEGYTEQIYRNSIEALDKINMNLGELHDYLDVSGSIYYYERGINETSFNRSLYNKIIDIVVSKYNVDKLKDIIVKRFCEYLHKTINLSNIPLTNECYKTLTKLGYFNYNITVEKYAKDIINEFQSERYLKNLEKNILDNIAKEFHKGVEDGLNSIVEPKLCSNIENGTDLLRKQCHNYSEEDVKMTKIMYGQNVLYNKMYDQEAFVVSFFDIDRVIFNNPATIVFWKDGTKTVVKANGGDVFNPEVGLMACFTKKALGNKYEYYGKFNKIINKYNKDPKKKVKPAAKKTTRKTVKK